MNLIDIDELGLPSPQLIDDLPASGKRLIQRASGFRATSLKGTITFENESVTGDLSG